MNELQTFSIIEGEIATDILDLQFGCPGLAVATRLLPSNALRAQTDRSILGTASDCSLYLL